MRMLQTAELPKLMNSQPGPCVSVYLGTRGTGNDPKTLTARWNGLVKEAEDILNQSHFGHRARFLLEPMRSVPKFVSNRKGNMEGVAFFRSFTTAGYYPVMEQTSERVTVADTFHLKPLLEMIQNRDRYFAVALSQKRITLFRGNRKGMRIVASYDADYGKTEKDEKADKLTTKVEVAKGKRGRNTSVHFRPLERVSRFVELTEPCITKLLQHEMNSLILVGTPFMHRLYRNVNSYPYLAEDGVLASVKYDRKIIHQRTWPIAERILLRHEALLSERYFEYAHQERASDDLAAIVEATMKGQISSLLLSKTDDSRKFGVLDRETGLVELRNRSQGELGDDVLDDIAQEVILRKGQVYVLPQSAMPTKSPIAAMFRW